jgi:dsRNA-specific ribonuclease
MALSTRASLTMTLSRLEFFGDCILKFIASVHLMADHVTWPESFLTGKKGKIVSNGFAARATLAIGLDQFILTKRFTGAKWAPRYAADVLDFRFIEEKRTVSSKLLADVIESLIGASYVVGGFPKAYTCIQTLLPTENWTPLPTAHTALFNAAPPDVSPNNLATLQSLIGYTFHKRSFLSEAITHGSCPISYSGPNEIRSYERLEFLGDAILDYIISRRLYAHTPPLSHQKMHGIRTAMANAAFLAFRMLETTVQETVMNTTEGMMRQEQRLFWLWQFMRANWDVRSEAGAHAKQHFECSEQIVHALAHDARFPWHLLALNDAPKFLSDIVESVIGAIYVDSRGDVAACEGFVERLGILQCLERILRDGVDCLHPKERLGHLAADREVRYVRVDQAENGVPLPDGGIAIQNGNGNRDAHGKAIHRVQVMVGGVKIGGMVEGLKRLNAETRAAFEAVKILEGGGPPRGDVEMRGGSQSSSDEDVFWEAETA